MLVLMASGRKRRKLRVTYRLVVAAAESDVADSAVTSSQPRSLARSKAICSVRVKAGLRERAGRRRRDCLLKLRSSTTEFHATRDRDFYRG